VAHITIEYVIMVPILIMQIILFPITANWLMTVWVDSRRTLALKEATSNLGSAILQLYFSLNHTSIETGEVTYTPKLPPFIENYHYVGNATLRTVDASPDSSKVLDLTLTLVPTSITTTTSVILGSNVVWQESVFVSNSTNAYVIANKTDEIVVLAFGG